jgi:uncharacterized protein (TIRG00374 family)
MKKIKWKQILSIVIIVAFGVYLYKNFEIFYEFSKITFKDFLVISVLVVIQTYLTGLFLKLLSKPFGVNLKKHFQLATSSALLNTISIFRGGGAALRALYLKKVHKLSYTNFASTYIGTYIITTAITCILSLLIILLTYLHFGIFNLFVTLGFAGILLATIIVANMKAKRRKTKNKIINKLIEIKVGWLQIKKDRIILAQLSILTIAIHGISIVINYYTMNAIIGMNVSLIETMFISMLPRLTTFISITPGSIGINEYMYYISSMILKLNEIHLISTALIIRAVKFVIFTIVGSISLFNISKLIDKHSKK